MKDRGIIKWQPFDSLISSREMINSILKNKNFISKPILSIDQLAKLDDLALENYYSQSQVNISYFKNNKIYKISGIITDINRNTRTITINKQLKLHISQILQINT